VEAAGVPAAGPRPILDGRAEWTCQIHPDPVNPLGSDRKNIVWRLEPDEFEVPWVVRHRLEVG